MPDGRRKVRMGEVVSDKMDKTVLVAVRWQQRHRLYKKSIRRITRFFVHDGANECRIGDMVRIEETRPLSKMKKWRVVEIVQRREVAEVKPAELDEGLLTEERELAAVQALAAEPTGAAEDEIEAVEEDDVEEVEEEEAEEDVEEVEEEEAEEDVEEEADDGDDSEEDAGEAEDVVEEEPEEEEPEEEEPQSVDEEESVGEGPEPEDEAEAPPEGDVPEDGADAGGVEDDEALGDGEGDAVEEERK
jgi:small subunit ribosomal protein S17